MSELPTNTARNPSGIGPGRQVLLASYGIETAADVVEPALAKVEPVLTPTYHWPV